MENLVARLDVAMFNAILRESIDDIPTDPVSDPISDAKVLPIPAGKTSFGAGVQLKNAVSILQYITCHLTEVYRYPWLRNVFVALACYCAFLLVYMSEALISCAYEAVTSIHFSSVNRDTCPKTSFLFPSVVEASC